MYTCRPYSHGPVIVPMLWTSIRQWSRLVKNVVWQTKILEGNSVKSDKCMGVCTIIGARSRAALKSLYAYAIRFYKIVVAMVTGCDHGDYNDVDVTIDYT